MHHWRMPGCIRYVTYKPEHDSVPLSSNGGQYVELEEMQYG